MWRDRSVEISGTMQLFWNWQRRMRRASSGEPENGFAVVAVLWLLSLLALFAGIYAFYVAQIASLGTDEVQRFQSQQLAISALELTFRGEAVGRGDFSFELGNSLIQVRVRPENGRIDLNAAPKELLSGLFLGLGADRREADEIGQRIVAWRRSNARNEPDRTNLPDRSSLERDVSRAGRFQHVNELALALGRSSEFAARARSSLTIYSGQSVVNVRDADPAVIAALPNMTPEMLNYVLSNRQTMPLDTLRAQLGSAGDYATVESGSTFRITVAVHQNKGQPHRFEIVAAPSDQGAKPYRILSWQDEFDGS